MVAVGAAALPAVSPLQVPHILGRLIFRLILQVITDDGRELRNGSVGRLVVEEGREEF
jgi:hypothetical protein